MNNLLAPEVPEGNGAVSDRPRILVLEGPGQSAESLLQRCTTDCDLVRVENLVRGLGLMLGLELAPDLPNLPGDTNKTQAVRFANLLHAAGLLAIPAGTHVLRFLPPLNLRQVEANEGLQIVESIFANLSLK